MSGDQLGALLPLVLLVLVFWFLILRPARNRQRQAANLQAELAVGADVMLTSGVFGKVTWLGDETVRVEIAPETTVRVHRQAVGKVLSDEESIRMASESSDVSRTTSSDAEPLDDDSSPSDSDSSSDNASSSDKGD